MANDRQYAETVEGIRADHIGRYMFAAGRLQGKKILDLACGCGYGSHILDQFGNEVTGVDISAEAIAYARKYYEGPTYKIAFADDPQGDFDALVTFETIEHLDKPLDFLKAQDTPLIYASVPNEEHYPFKADRFAGDEYPHKRHYTPLEFEALLKEAGIQVNEWFCQKYKKNKGAEIVSGTDGMFIIAVGSRD